jgi:multisubunit Na+/H+ antiporter MnhB subunit
VQYLLLASLVCSLFSAKVSVDLISGLSFLSEHEFAGAWDQFGVKLAILVCTPAAWMHFAMYGFAAALFAIGWHLNPQVAMPAVAVTTGFLLLLNYIVRHMVKGFDDPLGIGVLKDLQSESRFIILYVGLMQYTSAEANDTPIL